GISTAALAAGFIAAFVVGCLACRFMIDIVKRGKLVWFALYCAIVGVVAIGSYIF
ncbi:MAG: UDP-diphosphatase, partial [Alistipes sp.]|nr:UDP-diphosphatase [Alistipes sp.]